MAISKDDREILDNVGSSTWKGVADRLNRTGICTEFDVSFLSKDFIRRVERSVKVRLRKQGYQGRALIYIETNVGGVNGYAFYSVESLSRRDAQHHLEASIRSRDS
ncbi:hypothetical protein AB4Z52_35325 [Rhizobium sp. 2YAF20]|uniref:hypothetical protein n=1 Tax=Rhizobium sp. 2YAF20 TaxID=3233027 RepID=UPI003F96FCAE